MRETGWEVVYTQPASIQTQGEAQTRVTGWLSGETGNPVLLSFEWVTWRLPWKCNRQLRKSTGLWLLLKCVSGGHPLLIQWEAVLPWGEQLQGGHSEVRVDPARANAAHEDLGLEAGRALEKEGPEEEKFLILRPSQDCPGGPVVKTLPWWSSG